MKNSDLDLQKEIERYKKRALNNLKNLKKIENSKNLFKSKINKSLVNKPYEENYYKFIYERREKNIKILELCCGEGESSEVIIKNFTNIIFADISPLSLEVIKLKFKKYLTNQIKFVECNIESLPFKKDEFDLICCAGGLSYGDNDKVLDEIYRVLKYNGIFIAIDSLNENPIYKLNRYIHYLKGNRTRSTLKRMPDFKLIKKYKDKFGYIKIVYSGLLIWLLEPFSKFIGYKIANKISNLFDYLLPNWMAFKFIMEIKKIK